MKCVCKVSYDHAGSVNARSFVGEVLLATQEGLCDLDLFICLFI